jgi:hypothetical protein
MKLIDKHNKEYILSNCNNMTVREMALNLGITYDKCYYIAVTIRKELETAMEEEAEEPQPIINRPAAQYSNPQWHKLYQYAG